MMMLDKKMMTVLLVSADEDRGRWRRVPPTQQRRNRWRSKQRWRAHRVGWWRAQSTAHSSRGGGRVEDRAHSTKQNLHKTTLDKRNYCTVLVPLIQKWGRRVQKTAVHTTQWEYSLHREHRVYYLKGEKSSPI